MHGNCKMDGPGFSPTGVVYLSTDKMDEYICVGAWDPLREWRRVSGMGEKRAAFVERTAAYLEWHGFYDDAPDAFERAVDLALRYVTQSAA
jgi:hypothetical protein